MSERVSGVFFVCMCMYLSFRVYRVRIMYRVCMLALAPAILLLYFRHIDIVSSIQVNNKLIAAIVVVIFVILANYIEY